MKYTPEQISTTDLKKNDVFVFGSNESGIHGAGAAAFAEKALGAIRGQGFGLAGKTFAIPTKDWNIQTLHIDTISFYVKRFLSFAEKNPQLRFYVTKIGCGLAGWQPRDIAPLFEGAPENLIFPKEFADILWPQ